MGPVGVGAAEVETEGLIDVLLLVNTDELEDSAVDDFDDVDSADEDANEVLFVEVESGADDDLEVEVRSVEVDLEIDVEVESIDVDLEIDVEVESVVEVGFVEEVERMEVDLDVEDGEVEVDCFEDEGDAELDTDPTELLLVALLVATGATVLEVLVLREGG